MKTTKPKKVAAALGACGTGLRVASKVGIAGLTLAIVLTGYATIAACVGTGMLFGRMRANTSPEMHR